MATLTAVLLVVLAAARPAADSAATTAPTLPRAGVADSAAVGSASPAPSGPARGPRIPGTDLRLGAVMEDVVRVTGVSPISDATIAPDERSFAGPLPFFRLDGRATLVFGPDRRLARARFTVPEATPRQRQWVQDELERLGYRRNCTRDDTTARICDWQGAVYLHLSVDRHGLSAAAASHAISDRPVVLDPREDPAARAEALKLQPLLAGPNPTVPDTLSLESDAPKGKLAPPALLTAVPPSYSDALRASGVSGVVLVLALVNTSGKVVFSKALDGPAELIPFALEAVGLYQFGGYRLDGKPAQFWVRIPVRFI